MTDSIPMVVALADGTEHRSTQVAKLDLFLVPNDGSDHEAKLSEYLQVLPEL